MTLKERIRQYPLPGNTEDFRRLMDFGRYYVDKTLFIRDIMDSSYDAVLFTRPRRFGKTLNMSMLQTFFEKPLDGKDTSHYFNNLKIWQEGEKYTSEQGKRPVISLSLKEVDYDNFQPQKVIEKINGKKDLFIFLDSGNGTHGRRQLDWLEEQLSHRSEYRYCFVISHNWLFRTTYNYTTTPAANLPEDEQYAFMDLMSQNNVDLVIMGHFHYRDAKTFGGVKYVMTDNLNEGTDTPSYLVVRCADKVTYEYRLLNDE